MTFLFLLTLHPAVAWYRTNFYHGSKTCEPSSLAFSTFGTSIENDFLSAEKCRYYETYKPDGGVLYHLAFKIEPTARGYSLTDYKPSIGISGCATPPAADPATDPDFGFTLDFRRSKQCIGAASPDHDPNGESWSVEWIHDELITH
eukprot:GEMP01071302.1.p1 GENE.GEMP01071302.1~~GEMP01071302.1.p1  ORF type:complete len:146 (+),score=19.71 GEMP01071302.1:180-617(+)